MRKNLTVFIIIFSFYLLFCDESTEKHQNIDWTINYSAQPVEIQNKNCLSLVESYKKNVFEARYVISTGKIRYAERHFRKHLACWNDKAVYIEFGEFYESQDKYYLAALAYKNAGATDKITQANKKRIEDLNISGNNKFQELSETESKKLLKSHKGLKALSIASFVIGSAAFSTGAALFIHDKSGGTNFIAAQYSLILGGLSIIAGGIASDFRSKKDLALSNAISKGAKTYEGDNGTTPEEYYIYSGNEAKTQKNLSKMYRNHGITLMALSIPMFAIAIYGFFESYEYYYDKYIRNDESYDDFDLHEINIFFGHAFQLLSFAPAFVTLITGSIMIYKASKYEKLSTEPSLFTLTSITPVINPVSRTYGLSLGFSF